MCNQPYIYHAWYLLLLCHWQPPDVTIAHLSPLQNGQNIWEHFKNSQVTFGSKEVAHWIFRCLMNQWPIDFWSIPAFQIDWCFISHNINFSKMLIINCDNTIIHSQGIYLPMLVGDIITSDLGHTGDILIKDDAPVQYNTVSKGIRPSKIYISAVAL